MSEVGKQRRIIGGFRIVVALLVVVIVALAIAFGVVVSRLHKQLSSVPEACPSSGNIDLEPPSDLPPFHDLTREEIKAVRNFLYRQKDLNLVRPSEITVNSSYVFSFELHIPNKQVTTDYLDNGRARPDREARVVVFRGDLPDPTSEEYTVGPLPDPVYFKDKVTLPFRYRPLTGPEIVATIVMLNAEVGGKMNDILMECYGGRIEDCSDNCLEFEMMTPMASGTTGEEFRRKMWFWLGPTVEYFPLHALDFLVRVDLTSSKTSDYYIDQIYHANQSFYSVDELVRSYDAGDFVKTSIKYANADRNLFSSMNRRGTLFPTEPLSPPLQYEPDGKRYSIEGRHVNYMGWDFDVRMSTLSGPQLWNIKYNDNRIVYELSLQEIAVFYSAFSPGMRFADYVDSVAQIGTRARSLVAGADCPAHSTFLSAYHVIESQEDPMVVDRAFCVFELNTGMPLRRHLTSSGKNKFYEGMMDIVLTVRTIATVVNYDYIFDFVFHQNGALEVKATSTGYILTSFRFPSEDEYGFRLKDHLTGNIHHHMFHYKVDMDINGRENRFETIEIVPTEVDNSQWSKEKDAKYSQTKIVRKTMGYEKTAVIDYKFSTPKYLTFYNKDTVNSLGVPKAYRLLMRGMSKQLIKEGSGQEPSIPWARYQLAVTKYKEDERKSSSIYACWDANHPVVNFQSFIDDNDVIKDVDQVTWVTMGVHHIPHTEDLPVTPTVGLDLRFLLLPFNYFQEDPAMGSGDAVRIEPNNQEHVSQGLHVERYGRPENPQCRPAKSSFYQNIENKPESLFDLEEMGGI